MTTATLPVEPETLFSRARIGPCIGAIALVSLLAFEAMAVAAAMPAIAAALDGIRLYALAFGGMLATSVLGMVLAGRSCDRHGPLRATVAGLVVFAAGLLLAGLAPGMGWLVAGRIVQGLGGGMLGVALYVGMGRLVPPSLHPRLFALFAAAWVVPAMLGPTVAAWLVGQLGWRAVFLVVAVAVPLAAALLLPALGRLPAGTGSGAALPRAQVGWAALGALGALLLYGASQASATAPLLLALVTLVLGLGMAWAAAGAQMLTGQPAWIVVVGWALAGFGIGLSFPMLSVLTLGLSAAHEQGRNASALQLGDALCSSAALAAAGALFNQSADGGVRGYVLVMAVALLLSLTGAMLSRRAFG